MELLALFMRDVVQDELTLATLAADPTLPPDDARHRAEEMARDLTLEEALDVFLEGCK